MRHLRFKAMLLASAVLAAGFSGPAAADTLTEALAAAYTGNPDLEAERARLRATDESVATANSGWRPTVTVSGSYGFSNDVVKQRFLGTPLRIETDSKPYGYTVQATQNIFTGGRTIAGIRQAKANVRAGRAQLHTAEQNVLLDTVTAYVNVVRDEATVNLRRNNVEVLRRQLEAANDRFTVGEVTRTDVAQAEARLSGAVAALTAAEAQLTASREFYERQVGSAPGTLDATPPIPALPESEDAALAAAAAANPAIIAAREAAEAQAQGVNIALGALLPTVSVTGRMTYGSDDVEPKLTQTWSESITGNISIPIYQGGDEYADVRRQRQLETRSRLLISSAERQVREGTSNAWEALRAARDALKSREEQVRAAEIAFEGVRQEAIVGSRTTLDVLNAEQELLDARVALVGAQRDQYVAAYRLLASVGGLTAQNLGLPVEIYDPTAYYESNAGRWISWPFSD